VTPRARLRRAWRRQPVLVVAFALGATLTLAFAFRLTMMLLVWNDPQLAARPVEDWMTPRYLVKVYGLDPAAVADVLGIEPGTAPRQTLALIARARGEDAADLVSAVEALRTRGAE
jgi:hypothetical protein